VARPKRAWTGRVRSSWPGTSLRPPTLRTRRRLARQRHRPIWPSRYRAPNGRVGRSPRQPRDLGYWLCPCRSGGGTRHVRVRSVQRAGAPKAPDAGGRVERAASDGAGASGGARAHPCGSGGGGQTQGHGGARVWAEQSRARFPPLLTAWLAQDAWRMVSGVPDASSAHEVALRACAERGVSRMETCLWA
jgi:hypothetical protein